MKSLLYLSSVILCVFLADISLASTNYYWGVKSPRRKINFDGNIITKKVKAKSDGNYFNVILEIVSTNNNTKYPELTGGRSGHFIFYDAKLDEKSNRLAVIYDEGRNLIYDYYELQNDKWVLLKNISLFNFDLFFEQDCAKIEMVDMSNIKIVFNLMKKIGVTFLMENNFKMKDVEETFFITIKDDGKIFINDKEKTDCYISDYTTEEDKAKISKLKKQSDEWLKENHPEIK